jgi:hypothetical protein
MTDEGARLLGTSLARLFELVEGELNVAALWDGDRAEAEETVSRSELFERIAASGLGTKTRYIVAGAVSVRGRAAEG